MPASVSDFSRRIGSDGHEQWWLDILGKGDREQIVFPASPELVAELSAIARRTACRRCRAALTTRARRVHGAIKSILAKPRTAYVLVDLSSGIASTNSTEGRRTGYDTHRARIRPTAALTCSRCATTSVTCRLTRPVSRGRG